MSCPPRKISKSERERTNKILSGGDAARDFDRHLALVGDEGVNCPLAGRRVIAVFLYLEPLQPSDGGLGRVGNLGSKKGLE